MQILELLCNPRPSSFNQALALRAAELLRSEGHSVLFHDLYAEGFDPVMDAGELARGFSLDSQVQLHCRELESSQGLLIFHPDWWGGPPAVLKGWVDRVLRQGVAYDLEGGEFSEKDWRPLMEGKRALVYVTSNASGDESPAIETLWTRTILGKCGFSCECRVLTGLRGREQGDRARWMAGLESSLRLSFPAGGFPAVGSAGNQETSHLSR